MRWLIPKQAFAAMALWIEDWLGLDADRLAQLLDTAVVVVGYLLMRRVVRTILIQRTFDPAKRYMIGKTASYLLGVMAGVVIIKIWLRTNIDLATYLGILSAGLAVALQDPIANLAGWVFLVLRQPFRVGDRIQIGDQAGDVIDVRLFMFSVLEIGNWVNADQSTGRIIHVPNGRLFKEPIANYNQGFESIWNEVPVVITYESDWQKARIILQEIADSHSEKLDDTVSAEIGKLTDQFQVYFRHLTPIVWVSVVDVGVCLTLRYLCQPRRRRTSEDTIWRAILCAFSKEPTIDFAYPTQRFFDNRLEGKLGTRAPALMTTTGKSPAGERSAAVR